MSMILNAVNINLSNVSVLHAINDNGNHGNGTSRRNHNELKNLSNGQVSNAPAVFVDLV